MCKVVPENVNFDYVPRPIMQFFTASLIVLVAAVVVDLGTSSNTLRGNLGQAPRSLLAQTLGRNARSMARPDEVSVAVQENAAKMDHFLMNTFTNRGEKVLVADRGRVIEEDAVFSLARPNPDSLAARQAMFDVIIVLDSSGSIGSDEFLKAKQFMAEFVSVIPSTISPLNTRIACISFSEDDKIIPEFNFLDHNNSTDRQSVIQFINKIRYQNGAATHTTKALERAKALFATSGRRRAKRVLLLATDGYSNGGGNPAIPANEMKNTDRGDVLIQVVAVSQDVNFQEIEAIASSPSAENVYNVTTFTEATFITTEVRKNMASRGETHVRELLPVIDYSQRN